MHFTELNLNGMTVTLTVVFHKGLFECYLIFSRFKMHRLMSFLFEFRFFGLLNG